MFHFMKLMWSLPPGARRLIEKHETDGPVFLPRNAGQLRTSLGADQEERVGSVPPHHVEIEHGHGLCQRKQRSACVILRAEKPFLLAGEGEAQDAPPGSRLQGAPGDALRTVRTPGERCRKQDRKHFLRKFHAVSVKCSPQYTPLEIKKSRL